MKLAIPPTLTFLFLLGLLGCGKPPSYQKWVANNEDSDTSGDGGTTTPTTPNPGPSGSPFAALAGVYGGGSGVQVVTPNGEYWTWGGYGILFMKYGQLATASAGNFTGAITAGNSAAQALSGTYSAGVSFNGGSKSSATAPPLAGTVGTWWGNIQNGDTPYLDFSANGNISGTSANFHCSFSGKIQPEASGLPVFTVTLTQSNCLGNGQSEKFTGIVRVTGALMHLVALNDGKTKTLTWEAYKL